LKEAGGGTPNSRAQRIWELLVVGRWQPFVLLVTAGIFIRNTADHRVIRSTLTM
jgi:hypothetical protein